MIQNDSVREQDQNIIFNLADDDLVFRAAHDGSNAVKKWFENSSRM